MFSNTNMLSSLTWNPGPTDKLSPKYFLNALFNSSVHLLYKPHLRLLTETNINTCITSCVRCQKDWVKSSTDTDIDIFNVCYGTSLNKGWRFLVYSFFRFCWSPYYPQQINHPSTNCLRTKDNLQLNLSFATTPSLYNCYDLSFAATRTNLSNLSFAVTHATMHVVTLYYVLYISGYTPIFILCAIFFFLFFKT